MEYRREIDGLRALAILPVVFFHLESSLFTGGYAGVDVFFVISGYLITNIIYSEIKRGTFSLKVFYEKRARRILPALCLVLFTSCLFSIWWLLPAELDELSTSALSSIAFVSNFYFLMGESYFGVGDSFRPLLHTWSLAIEEQFYIFFPLLLILAHRFFRTKIIVLPLILFFSSIVLMQWFIRIEPEATFFLLPMRLWELMLGALVAILLLSDSVIDESANRVLKEFMAFVGLSMIFISVLFFDQTTPFPSIYALVPTVGSALVIVFANKNTMVAKFLGNKVLVAIGLISYSLYLWHYPLIEFSKLYFVFETKPFLKLILFIASFILAFVSWHFVEKPFRNRDVVSTQAFFYSALTSISIVVFLSFSINHVKANGYSEANKLAQLDSNQFAGKGFSWDGTNGVSSGTKTLLYGDSHALQLAPKINRALTNNNHHFEWLLAPACMSLPNLINVYEKDDRKKCDDQYQVLISKIDDSVDFLIIAYRWNKVVKFKNGDILGRVGTSIEAQKNVLSDVSNLIHRLSPKAKLILIGNVPTSNLIEEGGYIKCIRKHGKKGCFEKYPEQYGELFKFNRLLKQLEKYQQNKVVFINPYDVLCTNSSCIVREDEKLFYSDHAHLSHWGADLVTSSILKEINK